MRFLKFNDRGEPSLVERSGDRIPEYGILSHTWGADGDEVTYEDLNRGTAVHKSGYDKIRFCAERSDQDGLRFFWIDTCCINKANFTELSEAINSMYKWYRGATRCYVYLSDVPDPNDPASTVESAFPHSKWFTRGWTLQELIAPSSVQFFSRSGQLLGSKKSQLQQIHQLTGIDIRALQGYRLSEFSIEKRISWVAGRKTKVEEDAAYCLLGIFDCHMSLLYGEGRQRAFDRLQRKVQKSLIPSSFSSDRIIASVQPTAESWAVKTLLPYREISEQTQFGYPHGHISPPQDYRYRPHTLLQQDEALQTLKGHSDGVAGVAFSPDGKLLASASWDKTVRLWDAQSGKALYTLKGHSIVWDVAFSPNGKLLASASGDKTVRLWDALSGVALTTLEGHSDGVQGVVFSPDGRLLASASWDETVRLWDAQSGAALYTLMGHSNVVRGVAFSPNGKLLASTSDDKTVRLWDTQSGAALQTLEGYWGVIWSLAFSPNGKLLASASWDRTVRLWDAQSGAALHTLEGHSGGVEGVAFSPDGKLLASASEDKTVRLWDAQSGAALHTLEGHSDAVMAVAFSPNGRLLASASEDNTINLQYI